jgi:subtilisin family serine protease
MTALLEADGSFTSNANSLSGVEIAVLDTGISLNHPDLNVYRNISFVNGTITRNDDQGHGSHVAGIAAAKDNDVGLSELLLMLGFGQSKYTTERASVES